MHIRATTWSKLGLLPFILGALLLYSQPALAHSRVEVGPYVIIVGWRAEPAIVGERNALVIEILDQDDNPVTGVDGTMDLEVEYGGRTFRSNLSATPTDGYYTAEIFPTVRGQYAVHLFGFIEDEDVDVVVEPEEVFDASRIQFPEAAPAARDLQADIATLQADLQAARTMAYIGLGIGVLGVALAAFSLIRKR